MTFLIYAIKFTIGKSKEMVFTAGKWRDLWGKLDTLGEIPTKTCREETLPRYDRGSPNNDKTKPDLNSEHS